MSDSKSTEEIKEALIGYSLPDFYEYLNTPTKDAIRQSITQDRKFNELLQLFDQELERRVKEMESKKDADSN